MEGGEDSKRRRGATAFLGRMKRGPWVQVYRLWEKKEQRPGSDTRSECGWEDGGDFLPWGPDERLGSIQNPRSWPWLWIAGEELLKLRWPW